MVRRQMAEILLNGATPNQSTDHTDGTEVLLKSTEVATEGTEVILRCILSLYIVEIKMNIKKDNIYFVFISVLRLIFNLQFPRIIIHFKHQTFCGIF